MAKNGALKEWLLLQLEFLEVDAICCINDPVAPSVYKYLNKVGIKIPTKIGVTRFSNNPSSEIINPPMTTVDQQG